MIGVTGQWQEMLCKENLEIIGRMYVNKLARGCLAEYDRSDGEKQEWPIKSETGWTSWTTALFCSARPYQSLHRSFNLISTEFVFC